MTPTAPPRAISAIKPWLFVPVLYVMEAMPTTWVREVSTLVYKDFQVSNTQIAFWVSLLGLPWMLKPLWAPLLDVTGSRRKWMLGAQALITLLLAALAFSWGLPGFLPISIALLLVLGVASATHDAALDGLYLLSLDKTQQAYFVGVQTASYRAGRLLCIGALVLLAGILQNRGMGIAASWTATFGVGAALYGLGALYAMRFAPRPAGDVPVPRQPKEVPFLEAFLSFFTQRGILAVLSFILFYRFAEAMVSMMAPLFYRDPAKAGGMGLSVAQVGVISGVAGIVGIILGGIAGGAFIGRFGLRRSIWLLLAAMHAPNLLYLWAAATQPPSWTLYGVAFVDQFGYGFGFAGYSVFLMRVAQRGAYRTSHYAIATGLGAFTIMLAGMVSGWLQGCLGYVGLFTVVCLAAIPGLLTLLIIPRDDQGENQTGEAVSG